MIARVERDEEDAEKEGEDSQENGDMHNSRLITSATQRGMDEIFRAHPRFKPQKDYTQSHIDQERLAEGVRRAQGYIEQIGAKWTEEQKHQFLYEQIANYVASGGAFDRTAREVVLNESLEERARRGDSNARRELEGERYFDQLTGSFRELYDLMKSGDYRKRMPQLYRAVEEVDRMGFFDQAIKVLNERGLMNKEKYKMLKHSIRQRAYESAARTTAHIENYFNPRRIAASILGILSLIIIALSGAGITGNAIGNHTANAPSGIIGILLFLVSLYFFVRE